MLWLTQKWLEEKEIEGKWRGCRQGEEAVRWPCLGGRRGRNRNEVVCLQQLLCHWRSANLGRRRRNIAVARWTLWPLQVALAARMVATFFAVAARKTYYIFITHNPFFTFLFSWPQPYGYSEISVSCLSYFFIACSTGSLDQLMSLIVIVFLSFFLVSIVFLSLMLR